MLHSLSLFPRRRGPLASGTRHISLKGNIYKIISKMLSNSHKGVLDKRHKGVLDNMAFVEERHILDAALVANEVVV